MLDKINAHVSSLCSYLLKLVQMDYKRLLVSQLKEYAELLNLTQSEIARDCGVEQKTVSNWFNGRSVPNNKAIIERIEKLLGIEGDT